MASLVEFLPNMHRIWVWFSPMHKQDMVACLESQILWEMKAEES